VATPGRIDTRDLDKLERAFKRFQVRLPEAGEKALGEAVERDARQSAQTLQSRPGASGRYKREPGAYSDVVYKGDPAVRIEGGGTAIGAEFGTTYHYVFGRKVLAKSMKRRVFGARTGRGRLGKVVGKTAKANLSKTEREIALAFDREAEAEFRKAGL
jgi:hypothetical protein